MKKILILGGEFAGVEVLRKIQKKFNQTQIEIALEWFLDLFFRRADILALGSIKWKTVSKIDTPIRAVM